jgi:hypothetical protein
MCETQATEVLSLRDRPSILHAKVLHRTNGTDVFSTLRPVLAGDCCLYR